MGRVHIKWSVICKILKLMKKRTFRNIRLKHVSIEYFDSIHYCIKCSYFPLLLLFFSLKSQMHNAVYKSHSLSISKFEKSARIPDYFHTYFVLSNNNKLEGTWIKLLKQMRKYIDIFFTLHFV